MERFWKIAPWLLAFAGVLFLGWMLLGPDGRKKKRMKDAGADAGANAWRPDDFPLKVGEAGDNVLELQRRLNYWISNFGSPEEEIEEDGRFGDETKGAFLEWGGSEMPVTRENFQAIDPANTVTTP